MIGGGKFNLNGELPITGTACPRPLEERLSIHVWNYLACSKRFLRCKRFLFLLYDLSQSLLALFLWHETFLPLHRKQNRPVQSTGIKSQCERSKLDQAVQANTVGLVYRHVVIASYYLLSMRKEIVC